MTEIVRTEGRDLDTIAADIRRAHDEAQAAFGTAVDRAVDCGLHLLEAKEQVGHGNWLPWLEANFEFTRQTATGYMRLAKNRDQMEGAPSISEALKQLAPAKEPAEGDGTLRGEWDAIDADEDALRQRKISLAEQLSEQGDRLGAAKLYIEVAESLNGPPPWEVAERDILGDVQAMLPNIEGEQWESFKGSIARLGVLTPVIEDEHGRIIDGRQRVRACEELGIEYPTIIRSGLTEVEKARLCYSANVIRKSYTDEEMEGLERDLAASRADPQADK